MHSMPRLSVNDSNNNSIISNKDNTRMANSIIVTQQDDDTDSLTSEITMKNCGGTENFPEDGPSSPLVVDHVSQTPSPTDFKSRDTTCRRPSSLVSPSSSIASHSPSPDRHTVVGINSPEARYSPKLSILSNLTPKSPPISKPGLSFSIDRILGNSTSRTSEDLTQRSGRVSSATGNAAERRSKHLTRYGSVSDESDDSPTTPRSPAPSPSEDEPNGDLVHDRLVKDTATEPGEADHAKRVLGGFAAQRPGYPRPLIDNFRFPGAPGNGHLARPGYQDLVVSELAGHTGHMNNGPHNPYHNPGMFLPHRPPSEINRIEQHSTSSLSSLDLLPVRPILPDVFVCPWTGVQRDRFGLVRRIGHPYQNRTPPKRKKPRTAFTRQQVLELEKRFSRQKYLASAERSSLAKSLGMSDAQVKTWFQNRRTKWRRQTAEEREIERQAAHKFLLSLRPDDPPRPLAFTGTPGVSMCPTVASQPGRLQTQPEAASVQDIGLS